jgi:uncharacterized membrane-anchored protein
MRMLTIIGFFVLVAAQWYVPVSMIKESEDAVAEGVELKFQVRPVDPSDAFRGKYVQLDFPQENFELDTVPQFFGGDYAYAPLEFDSAGYAVIKTLLPEDPGNDVLALKVKVRSSYTNASRQSVLIEFPFDRFYVEESKASDAEKVYWQNVLPTDPGKQTYAVVRVLGRRAVLMDVKIGDRSLLDIVREMNTSEK